MPNQDVWVYFKITPFDRDTGKYAISGKFKVDNGDGTFATKVDYEVGSYPRDIAFGDIDGDGDIDIAVANQSSNTVSIILGME